MPGNLRTGAAARRGGNEQQTARLPVHWPHFSRGRTMTVRLIQNGQEYREARQTLLDLVDRDPAPGSPDGNRLEVLVRLVAQYEPRFMPEVESGKPAVR